MKYFWIIALCSTIVSCTSGNKIEFEGDLVAKTVLQAKYNFPSSDEDFQISWYISDLNGSQWTKLEGIHSREIVLLTDYVDKYLKCRIDILKNGEKVRSDSIISDSKIKYCGNPNVDWFKDAGTGLMVHFLKGIYTDGGSKEWNDIVNGFNVELFANDCKAAGVGFVIFALGQNDGYYCSPNSAYDSIVGINPGDLCSLRDLPADLFQALDKYGIKMMFYLPGNPPISNQLVDEKFKYTYGKDSPTSQFTQARWEEVIREWSMRYGKKNSGWWFDGMYRGGIIETRSDMTLKHNISTHTLAAKAGNYNSIVCYNYGVNTIRTNSPYDDYSAGEENNIGQLPASRWVADGVQWFCFTHLGDWWGRGGTRYETDELTQWAEKVFENEGVLCFDVHAYKSGAIDPVQIDQLKAVKEIKESVSSR